MPRQIVVNGANLFWLAAQELGDATQWIRIAQLNGLADPLVAGIQTLLIPDPNPEGGGGVAVQ